MENPNPYDCEPYYNLGLALLRQGKQEAAFDAFYKATWDGSMQGRAFYQLACLSSLRGEYSEALSFAERSLVFGLHNLKARTLKPHCCACAGKPSRPCSLPAKRRKSTRWITAAAMR